MGEPKNLPPARKPRWHFQLVFVVIFAGYIYSKGGWYGSALAIAVVAAFALFLHSIEKWTRRPLRSYLRLAFGSAVLLALLMFPALLNGGKQWPSQFALWAGMATLGLVWTVYYERTEPLPSDQDKEIG